MSVFEGLCFPLSPFICLPTMAVSASVGLCLLSSPLGSPHLSLSIAALLFVSFVCGFGGGGGGVRALVVFVYRCWCPSFFDICRPFVPSYLLLYWSLPTDFYYYLRFNGFCGPLEVITNFNVFYSVCFQPFIQSCVAHNKTVS